MSDIDIRIDGQAGRITLQRAEALNAVTYEMLGAIEAALDAWATDDRVALVMIDAEGDKAFSAGGDLQQMYDTATAGDFAYGRRFWHDEYRLNAKIARYPKPYVAFCQGFTMGGGVGISLHGSHRVVGESSRIAMPECGVGLVPDVGGSLLLARAPGFVGELLGMSGHRMGAGDAIWAGFADLYVPEDRWEDVKRAVADGNGGALSEAAQPPPHSPLSSESTVIDSIFSARDLPGILAALPQEGWWPTVAAAMRRGSPLAVACTVALIRHAREANDIHEALRQEYRFSYRSASDGDFIEGIRAAIIDKDRSPKWRHAGLEHVSPGLVAGMLGSLGHEEWEFTP